MKPRFLVVDTNVLISGLLSNNAQSPTVRIVDAMLEGRLVHLLSPALLREYRQVLLRPKIQAAHLLSDTEIDQILSEITLGAVWQEPTIQHAAPDSGDNHIWSLLLNQKDTILVTGDQLLLDKPPKKGRVISPALCAQLFLDAQHK